MQCVLHQHNSPEGICCGKFLQEGIVGEVVGFQLIVRRRMGKRRGGVGAGDSIGGPIGAGGITEGREGVRLVLGGDPTPSRKALGLKIKIGLHFFFLLSTPLTPSPSSSSATSTTLLTLLRLLLSLPPQQLSALLPRHRSIHWPQQQPPSWNPA